MDVINSVKQVLKILKKQFPRPGAMELGDSYRTIVGVILSARTRDEQVLKLLPGFFKAFPSMDHLAKASVVHIESQIDTIGMYRQKAKHLQKMAEDVVERFDGQLPDEMDALITLAGVGRKTASVVLAASFQQPSIAVDTHVFRVTNRLGWVKTSTPEKTEQALLALIPKKLQTTVNRVFVPFGRYICLPGTPRCYLCPVKDLCQFKQKQLSRPKNVDVIVADIARRQQELEVLRKKIL